MAEIDGLVALAHGTNPEEAIALENEIWQEQRTFLDNDQSTTPHYYVWPTFGGRRLGPLRPAGYNPEATHNLLEAPLRPSENGRAFVHIDSGEVPYLISIPETTATLDSDSSNFQLFLKFKRINVNTGKHLGHQIYNAAGDRNTDTNNGGIADDPQLIAGQRNIAYAFDRVAQNQGLIQIDHLQVDLDDAA